MVGTRSKHSDAAALASDNSSEKVAEFDHGGRASEAAEWRATSRFPEYWTAGCASVLSSGSNASKVQRARQARVVELAVIQEDVGVGVGGDRQRALADAGTDQRPGLALAVPEADAAVAEVVRRPGGGAGCFAGAGDRRSHTLLGQTGKDGPIRGAVLTGRERGEDGG